MILGISSHYHDSAAALVANGNVLAAAQEERFTRIKHDPSFPIQAIEYCLDEAGICLEDLSQVVYYEKPYLKFDRLLETYLGFAPLGLRSFVNAMPNWLREKLHLSREIKKNLPGEWNNRIVFVSHHESHAASAFFPSPFDEAAILTMDGVGEWDTATIGEGSANRIEILRSLQFPDSLGLLYSAFTYFAGFKVNSGEYKLMGLAPYGKPIYKEIILDKLLDLKSDGSFTMNMDYFAYCHGLTMTTEKFSKLFGGPPRKSESQITEREMNLASSIQAVTEEIVLRMASYARDLTGKKNLCLSGGVALNCVANGKLLDSGLFDRIWVQPASGDAGGALGCALFSHYQLLNQDRIPEETDSMRGSYLGPAFGEETIREFLDEEKAPYHFYENEDELLKFTAQKIADENIIGWFDGRMEFGPRALGNRSILGDARSEKMQVKMNVSIKFRESFRPFAPSVLKERVKDYFKMETESPYMLIVAPVKEDIRRKPNQEEVQSMKSENLLERVAICRSTVPAITHIDYSARVQTVSEARNERYYRLIKRLEKITGCGLVVNTSFNIRGEPIVCTPQDAYRCFLCTDMDVLVLGNFILVKEEQPIESLKEKEKYIASFDLD
ncbi:MAG: carbamoyltransferase [Verrucomicrobiota bacterium]|nr:carbamoyltransferase [Verrucomicrobiota bacterium]MEC8792042.1 carbamoyltransferase [Verrucomicrobiota bacterium]MEC8866501.1 carbamoyltransferase [Verrucomicrobiota bacterium]